MREIPLPPNAPAMLESLRAIGYSFESAVADIIDNSISAECTSVDIQFRPGPEPYVSILDDGLGMDWDELTAAMQHGGRGPKNARNENDLGRFGLGLKTASLSQCRVLTVLSRKNGTTVGARWDLDRVEAARDWVLGVLEGSDFDQTPGAASLAEMDAGTIVVWQDFDRATAGESKPGERLGELVDLAREHLALVFHRFLSGSDGGRQITIEINNAPVKPVDPYLASNPGTQALQTERIRVEDSEVVLQPYILPHMSRMSKADLELAGGEVGLRRNQGFYVYRSRRLITFGTWFRLLRQEELTKLARVQVDISNELDHLWALDVKKSRAHPPEAVRVALLRVVERIAGSSRRVYKFRGRKATTDVVHIWDRVALRDGVAYRLNRDHPMVLTLNEELDGIGERVLDQFLQIAEMSLPVDAIYADMASDQRVHPATDGVDTANLLEDLARQLTAAVGDNQTAINQVLDRLPLIEPFASHPAIARKIIEGLR